MAEIQIEFDVPAEMRDGTVLRADVYRPGDTGPWPVLLSRLPYGKHTPVAAIGLDGLWTRGGAIELGITVPWSLMQGADTLTRRHRTDLAGLVSGVTGLVRDLDGLAGGGYGGAARRAVSRARPARSARAGLRAFPAGARLGAVLQCRGPARRGGLPAPGRVRSRVLLSTTATPTGAGLKPKPVPNP
ncbi:hypothetical protein ALI22I_44105 [Saccharothrix sp. ALI-22-I]|uniref:CocE/NonD family hydrolase n=1 Tax=Saccharothrix sp. ALI-22-I TaxID=1933778 RepID=UPI00097BB7B1|nr:CocE/NonD family hydrolase [Saccharothrix sp. ALI-22-I]ONI80335.1 hypothetical protein ALI22I_44105 [Saccharothrix sp. ALI-22-I]